MAGPRMGATPTRMNALLRQAEATLRGLPATDLPAHPPHAVIWQAKDAPTFAQHHRAAEQGHTTFPDGYAPVACVPDTDPEAVFTRAQHREALWHEQPGVHAAPGARPHSLSVGDVISVRDVAYLVLPYGMQLLP